MTGAATRVAIDLGGTRIRAARVSSDGQLFPGADLATPTDDLSALLAAVAEAVARCGAGHPEEGARTVVGMGMPGVIDRATGRLIRCQNIPAADGVAFHDLLAAHLRAEVRLDNDVNLAAVGERSAGAAAGTEDLVVLSLGTGVGAGIVSGGRLLRGAHGLAAEVADLPLFGDPWDPETRFQGPLEQAIGSVGLLRDYCERGGRGQVTDVEQLVGRRDHDPIAAAAIARLAERVVITILALRALLDPAVVVLTGGIGAAPPVVALVQELAGELLGGTLDVQVSALGAAAGLHGAGVLSLGQVEPWVVAHPQRSPAVDD